MNQSDPAAGLRGMRETQFIPCDAHEGCVWVAAQRRLYFSSTKNLDSPRVSMAYLDFSQHSLQAGTDITGLTAVTWRPVSNMANSFCLSNDGQAFLVAEQGTRKTRAAITRIELQDQRRTVLFDRHREMPLNSPNKVIQTRAGHLILSDPDYGFRQGFRPPPILLPQLYVLPANGKPYAYRAGLEMPHGLALSPDERTLFVTDTSADGAHGDLYLERRRRVYALDFDPQAGQILGNHRYCFATEKGVPDGCFTTDKHLLVGGGDGVYVADLEGNLRGKIPLERTAVNLAVVEGNLFVTADEGVYFIPDWEKHFPAAG